MSSQTGRYAVRNVIEHESGVYEERIILSEGRSLDEAIANAEPYATAYAHALNAKPLALAQAYGPLATEFVLGTELFSLIRESQLTAREYLEAFFHTGAELQDE